VHHITTCFCGADVGTNLIDGHISTLLKLGIISKGADVGTNLIDGHISTLLKLGIISKGADVGTNLIDGHDPTWAGKFHKQGCRRRHQPDRRTP